MVTAAMKATAPRARSMTREQWERRARELGAECGLVSQVSYLGINDDNEHAWLVPSRSHQHRVHIVTAHLTTWRDLGNWHCGCEAAEHGLPCGHVGACMLHDEHDGDANRPGLVWSTRTRRWMSQAQRAMEDRAAANGWHGGWEAMWASDPRGW